MRDLKFILAGLAVLAALALPDAVRAAAAEPGADPGSGEPRFHAPDLPGSSSPLLRRASSSSSLNRKQLRKRLEALSRSAPSSSGYYVFDPGSSGKRVLFAKRANDRRKLASNTKLFTTATALAKIGSDERLETAVKVRGRVRQNGVLRGSLYLVGAGDPAFGADGAETLARAVARSGISRVKGDLIGDDTIFDRVRGVPDSNWGPSQYIRPLSGLTYGGSTYATDPALAATQAFREALAKERVKVSGKVRLRELPKRLRTVEPLAVAASPTIAALAEATNEVSNNFYAEMLLKGIAAAKGMRGTTRKGAKVVENFARTFGARIDARDGSGLTDRNLASPRSVVRLLAGMRGHGVWPAFHESLPVAGREGTLDERMEGTAAAGRCRAKTGTINGVSTLSGYCNSGSGKVAFSLLMNGVGSYEAARDIQDRMVVEIARYRG